MAKRKECKKCYTTRNECPIIVKVHKEDNDGSGCGKPCLVHINGLNRFPNITAQDPTNIVYPTNCENCLQKIRERDVQLFDKEREKLKIITDFLTFPRNNDNNVAERDIQHNFKGLQEMENELLRKEREIAMMKKSACDDVCYNVLRQKQLELRWKDFELERQRPNIIVRCKKKFEKMREEHCFTALQKKERELLKKEKKIDEVIEKFRERKFNEEMRELEDELERRLKPIDADIDCSCDCAKYNEIIDREKKRQEKMSHDACCYFPIGGYIPFWTCDTMELLKKTAYCPQEFTK